MRHSLPSAAPSKGSSANSDMSNISSSISSNILSIEGLTCRFEDKAVVDDVSLHVRSGETLCLLGPSGSGKSTTLRLIAGFERPQSGRITIGDVVVDGDGMRSVPPEDRGLGYLFQEYALFPHLNLEQNLAFGLHRLSARDRAGRVEELLETIGLAPLRRAYPNSLSGGEQQRVALARALAAQPKLLLMDEPFSSLDPQLRMDMRRVIKTTLADRAIGSVIVTHDAEDAMALADRIAVMIDGRIVQCERPEILYRHPNNRIVARIFGEFNELPVSEIARLFPDLVPHIPPAAQSMAVRHGDIWPDGAGDTNADLGAIIRFSADVTPMRDMGHYVQCVLKLSSGMGWEMNYYGSTPKAGPQDFSIAVDHIAFFDDK